MEKLSTVLLPTLSRVVDVPWYEWLLLAAIAVALRLYWLLDCHFLKAAFGSPFTVQLIHEPSSEVARVIRKAWPAISNYRPTPWLCSPHLQTLYLHYSKSAPKVTYDREILRSPDGGSVGLDWAHHPHLRSLVKVELQPVVVIVPGLTSDSNNGYIRHLVADCGAKGFKVVVVNHRGCGGVPLTSDVFYNAGWTDDLRMAIKHVRSRLPQAPLALVGTSLGANIAIKFLGEEGRRAPVVAAVAMGCPFDLMVCDRTLQRTRLKKLYSSALALGLREAATLHQEPFSRITDWALLSASRTVREFDDNFTRIAGKFETVDAYYRQSSCSQYITSVQRPLLCLSALDDPICCREGIPFDECKQNPNVVLAASPRGGHLAWYEGLFAGRLWWVRPTTEFLAAMFAKHSQQANKTMTSSSIQLGTPPHPLHLAMNGTPGSPLESTSTALTTPGKKAMNGSMYGSVEVIPREVRSKEEQPAPEEPEDTATSSVSGSSDDARDDVSRGRSVVLDFKGPAEIREVEIVLAWLLQRLRAAGAVSQRQKTPLRIGLDSDEGGDPRASAAAAAAAASSAAASASAMAKAAAAMVQSSAAQVRRLKRLELEEEREEAESEGKEVDWEMGTPVSSRAVESEIKAEVVVPEKLEGRMREVGDWSRGMGVLSGGRKQSAAMTWLVVCVAVAVTFPLVGSLWRRRLMQHPASSIQLVKGLK